MNETRRIALEFAMRLNPPCENVALEMARRFEAYLEQPECFPIMTDHMGREIADPHIARRFEARP